MQKIPYNMSINLWKGCGWMVEYMTGKEIVNLINKLEEEGMTAEKIIEIIKYVETADPKDPSNNK